MKLHRVTTVLVALSCIAAVGVASTTLETTFETNPDEVVDLSNDDVPISPDEAGSLDRAMSDAKESGQGGASSSESGEVQASDGGDEAERQRRVDGEADAQEQSRQSQSGQSDRAGGSADGGEADGGDAASGGDQSSAASRSSSDSESTSAAARSWLDRLLSLLETWLPLLVVAAVVAAFAAVLVRYRDRIARQLRRPPAERGGATRRRPEPENAAERAWVAVLAAADVDDPWHRTPEECAAAAVDAGFDPEGVERLRRVFEEVRYGDREVTPDRRRRVERGLDRLNLREMKP